jgi:hypothetical protein
MAIYHFTAKVIRRSHGQRSNTDNAQLFSKLIGCP